VASACSPTSSDGSTAEQGPADTLAAELLAFERLLSACYATCGRLSAAAASAQAHHNLSVVAGHQILSAISAAQGEVASAIGKSAEAHRMIEVVGRRLGYDPTAYGDQEKDPGAGFTTARASGLRAVA